jgi:hypothetical protein
MAHVALKVLFGGKLHPRELLEDVVDRGGFRMLLS